MIFDLNDSVKVAYKKLKQMIHFEKNSLSLRRRLAEFECEGDFEERLQIVAKVAKSKLPHETDEFKAWLEDIHFDVIPKGVQGPEKPREGQGSFVSNVTTAPVHWAAKVNYMFDGPIELHLVSVLWLMTEGVEYDETVGADAELTHCRDVIDPVCSLRTIACAGFVPIWGGSVLRQHLGQFGIGVNIHSRSGVLASELTASMIAVSSSKSSPWQRCK